MGDVISIIKDPWFGYGLTDRKGKALRVGDTVIWRSKYGPVTKHKLVLKKWTGPIGPDDDRSYVTVKRVLIGNCAMWLNPITAKMIERA